MNDPILKSFLEVQHQQAMALAAASDILELEAEPAAPPQKYIARFKCRGLMISPGGRIEETDEFVAGIWLPDDYLRSVDPEQVVNILKPQPPRSIWHPNAGGPFICLGRLAGGTSLVDILYQTYEIISYQKWAAHDGLNPAACEWARHNQYRFPIDRRPLKWRGGKP